MTDTNWNDHHPINDLFEQLVPSIGSAPTINGEVVRHACHIGHRWFNDGERVGDPNADSVVWAVKQLRKTVGRGAKARQILDALTELRERRYSPDREYSHALKLLADAAVEYCANPDQPNPSYKEDDDDL